MSDVLFFDEGAKQLLTSGKGLPGETYFALSTRAVLGAYSATVKYGLAALVTEGGKTYESLKAENEGHKPSTSAEWWKEVAVTGHATADTFEGGVGKITGTGYEDKHQATPAAEGEGEGERKVPYVKETWETGEHTDWLPARSYVAYDNTTKKALWAQNLQTGVLTGAVRNLAAANTKEELTPTLKL